MSLSDRVHHAKQQLDLVIKELAEVPDKSELFDLFKALDGIEQRYIEFCDTCDDDEPGATNRDGISLEFYIEAEEWHKVSIALRNLRKLDACPPFPW